MYSIQVDSAPWSKTLSDIGNQIEAQGGQTAISFRSDCEVHLLFLENGSQTATLGGVNFKDGLSLFWVRGIFQEAWELKQGFSGSGNAFRFLNIAQGEVQHLFSARDISHHLNPVTAGIRVGPSDQDIFRFPRQEEVFFCLVDIEQRAQPDQVPCLFDQVLPKLNRTDRAGFSFVQGKFFLGNYGLAIGTTMRDMDANEYTHFARYAFLKAKALEIVSDHTHHVNVARAPSDSAQAAVLLDTQKVKLIQEAANILIERMASPPTIPELAREVGMSETALKKGFKMLFRQTVRQYLRVKRLHRALFLLENSEDPISEVAHQVGYRHNGYFAKQFQQQFGLSPRQVLQNRRQSPK